MPVTWCVTLEMSCTTCGGGVRRPCALWAMLERAGLADGHASNRLQLQKGPDELLNPPRCDS